MHSEANISAPISLSQNGSRGFENCEIPVGLTHLWILALGSDVDVFSGTPYSSLAELRDTIALKDDLRITANLLKAHDDFDLLAAILNLKRATGDIEAMSAKNLAEALQLVASRIKAENRPFYPELGFDKKTFTVTIAVNEAIGILRPFYEFALLLVMYRVIAGFAQFNDPSESMFREIGLFSDYPVADTLSRLEPLIAPAKLISGARSKIMGPIELLDLKSPVTSPILSRMTNISSKYLSMAAPTRKGEDSGESTYERITQTMELFLLDQRRLPQVAELCASLDLSKRSIYYELRMQNATFRDIARDVRLKLAKEMLTNSNLSVKEISFELGFSESSSFVRAFRNWVGQSPLLWASNRKQAKK